MTDTCYYCGEELDEDEIGMPCPEYDGPHESQQEFDAVMAEAARLRQGQQDDLMSKVSARIETSNGEKL